MYKFFRIIFFAGKKHFYLKKEFKKNVELIQRKIPQIHVNCGSVHLHLRFNINKIYLRLQVLEFGLLQHPVYINKAIGCCL